MVLSKNDPDIEQDLSSPPVITSAKKRRIRRRKLQARLNAEKTSSQLSNVLKNGQTLPLTQYTLQNKLGCDTRNLNDFNNVLPEEIKIESNFNVSSPTMSTNTGNLKRKDVISAKEIKRKVKQNLPQHRESTETPLELINKETNLQEIGKSQDTLKKIRQPSKLKNEDCEKSFSTDFKSTNQIVIDKNKIIPSEQQINLSEHQNSMEEKSKENILVENSDNQKITLMKCEDEVDRAFVNLRTAPIEKSREQIKAEREAKKLAKQAKKKGHSEQSETCTEIAVDKELTSKNVVETLANIAEVVKDVQEVAIKVSTVTLDDGIKHNNQDGDQQKSKAELRAERRAKQEAQRAAKSGSTPNLQIKISKEKAETAVKSNIECQKTLPASSDKNKKLVPPKQTRVKTQNAAFRVDWFEHLYPKVFENPLNNVPLNSELHPAIVKLGVQLNTGVVFGSNARCVALLNAMKHVISDYKVPDKTEFARGLDSYLTTNANFLWKMREPNAAQTNAMNFLRFQLTDFIKKNIEDDEKNSQAKKLLLGEIDKYVGDQIDKAGEAISLTVRDKISNGDTILTYGCSSLIEKILCDARDAGLSFHAVVAGSREAAAGREMLRRLAARRHPVTYIDITALSFAMRTVDKVIIGASSVLMNGSVLGAAGTLQVALVARAHNVPLLVCCETHKFSDKVLTDAFVYNELGDPRDLVDEESPIKDWRSRVNLNVLNLMYDVTPANLVTAVVTELDILPCTSAPVVHRIKLTNN